MLYYLIVFLPLIGFLVAGIGGRTLGIRSCEILTSSFMVLSAILSWFSFIFIGFLGKGEISVPLFDWVKIGTLEFHWNLYIDTLTAVMLVVVNTVSALVHIYSIGYMHHDPSRPRFFAYLSLFTFMMLMLVTSDNLLQMFFGWEGVGLASYLLIGFWYEKTSANKAAIKAFVTNRVGDFGFLLGIFCIFTLFNAVDFDQIFSISHNNIHEYGLKLFNFSLNYDAAITLTCLFLFIGAMGKSAQFLLHVWLPDAMEGPTPVSALIHAATMVTAGVFMVARMSPLFELSQMALDTIIFIGTLTAFFAATVALVQNDIKKIIAYSTCSQLGYMFVAIGVGAYGAAVFHLFTHAFFKALLFLSAGSVIHAVSDEQDIRRMGGLKKYIPTTYWMMIIGTLALTGFGIPGTLLGTAGFFSKDMIIESSYASHSIVSNYSFYILVFTAFLTSFYSWRLIFMTFHGKSRITADVLYHIHESPYVMLIPLFVLSFGALFAGYIFAPYFIGEFYDNFWKGSLFVNENNHILHDVHSVPLFVKLSSFFAMILGLLLAFWFYILQPKLPKKISKTFPRLYDFFLNKWYFDELYNIIFVRTAFFLGDILWKLSDIRIIDNLGPNAIARRVSWVTSKVVRMQTGYVYHYAFAMLIGVVALITWMMIKGVI